MSSLDALRVRGMRMLTVVGWLCLPLLYIWGELLGSANTELAIAVAATANIIPTLMAVRGRHVSPRG